MMNRSIRGIVLGLALGGAIGLCGCEVEPDGGYVETGYGYYDEPVPAGYYYGPAYYNGGYYDGDYWRWHDHDHWYHEGREMHEGRMRGGEMHGGRMHGGGAREGGGHDRR